MVLLVIAHVCSRLLDRVCVRGITLALVLLALGGVPSGAAAGAAEPAVQALTVQVQVARITATTSPWSLRQRLIPPDTLMVHTAGAQDARLLVTVQRGANSGRAVYHLDGTIALANRTAAPVTIARLTVQLLSGQARAASPLIPVNFSSPLASGARVTLPYTADVHLDTGASGSGLALRAMAMVLSATGPAQLGASVPLPPALPAPQSMVAPHLTVRARLRLTDTSAYLATLGEHSAGATAAPDGVALSDTPTLPIGGSRTYMLDLRLTARRHATARLIGTSELIADGVDVTDCGAGAACPSIGTLLIGGD